jgi:ketohexokinase
MSPLAAAYPSSTFETAHTQVSLARTLSIAMSARPIVNIVCVGAVYIDTIWTYVRIIVTRCHLQQRDHSLKLHSVPNFPAEDTKLRAETVERRRGGNVANTLEVLEQIVQAHCDSVPDGTKDESIRLPRTRLYLMSALPDRNSEDAAFISQRLPNVLIRDIFRDNCPKAPASMIIQNRTTASRTIISHGSGVEELTAPEFVNGIDFWSNAWPTDHKDALRKTWVHFEGRNPTITHDCIAKLRNTKFETHTEVKISVECEKPERKALEQAAQLADVVFYSKLWAEVGLTHCCCCIVLDVLTWPIGLWIYDA